MKGININCKDRDYIAEILRGEKIIETRDSKSLHPYIGQRIGLVETGRGKAKLRGYATISAVYRYNTKAEFDNHSYMHRIYDGDRYYIDESKGKYGYVLEDVVYCDPRVVMTRGIVAREV